MHRRLLLRLSAALPSLAPVAAGAQISIDLLSRAPVPDAARAGDARLLRSLLAWVVVAVLAWWIWRAVRR